MLSQRRSFFVASLLLNAVAIASAGIVVHHRGGLSYLRSVRDRIVRTHASASHGARADSWAAAPPWFAERARLLATLPVPEGATVLIGDSLTHGGEWQDAFPSAVVRNRGLGHATSAFLRDHVNAVLSGSPSKVFLLIGVNDLRDGSSPEAVAGNIRDILCEIRHSCPSAALFIQAVLPSGPDLGASPTATRALNDLLPVLAQEGGATFLDTFTPFVDSAGRQVPELFTGDRLHLSAEGYEVWTSLLSPLVTEPPPNPGMQRTRVARR